MNITITINNASSEVLAAISHNLAEEKAAFAAAIDAAVFEIKEKAAPHQPPVQAAPIITPQPDPQDTALRIASVADIDNYLDVGSEVHWRGAKFEFDGVVEKIEGEEAWTDTTKILFIRRNDTDKLVSLTLRDLQTGRLTLID